MPKCGGKNQPPPLQEIFLPQAVLGVSIQETLER